ncbi:MAG: metal ABC transporter substrate-binding protein [Candidatus Latescibacterota bacterium]
MKSIIVWGLVLSAVITFASPVHATIRIVASTTDLASIADYIGGDKVRTESIASGKANPHYVEVLPSYMVKVARADIYLKIGMDLDMWANYLIDGSRNGHLVVVDCSEDIEILDKPTRKVDASMGDIHPSGNPHYWLNPDNGIKIARAILAALKQVDSQNSDYYDKNFASFAGKIERKKIEWLEKARPLVGLNIITYHNSWPYFCRSFGIQVVGHVEPKPGIEPTPSHTAKLVQLIKASNIKIIGKEPYFSDRTPNSIARATAAKVVDLPPSVGGVDGASDYFRLFDTLLDILLAEL